MEIFIVVAAMLAIPMVAGLFVALILAVARRNLQQVRYRQRRYASGSFAGSSDGFGDGGSSGCVGGSSCGGGSSSCGGGSSGCGGGGGGGGCGGGGGGGG